jgi:hypothetical protein
MNLADYLFTNTRPKLSDYKTDFEKADYLRNILISRCTNGAAYDEDYKFLRNYFLNKADTKTFVLIGFVLIGIWHHSGNILNLKLVHTAIEEFILMRNSANY